jgi:hypothetical protein
MLKAESKVRAAPEPKARCLAGSSQSNPARQVKLDRDVFGVSGEVCIGRENLQAVPGRDGAYQQVRPGTLQASLAKAIIISGGGFIILFVHRQIGVEPQIFLELLEAFVRLSAGKQFLADGAEQLHRIAPHQARDLLRNRV